MPRTPFDECPTRARNQEAVGDAIDEVFGDRAPDQVGGQGSFETSVANLLFPTEEDFLEQLDGLAGAE